MRSSLRCRASWGLQAAVGLCGEDQADSTRHNRWRVDVKPEDAASLDVDVSGEYALLDRCGCNDLRNGGGDFHYGACWRRWRRGWWFGRSR